MQPMLMLLRVSPVFVGIMSANPDIKLVVTDHGALTATLETFLSSAGYGPDDVLRSWFRSFLCDS